MVFDSWAIIHIKMCIQTPKLVVSWSVMAGLAAHSAAGLYIHCVIVDSTTRT